MPRRSPKSGTPLNEKQAELARREAQLPEQMQTLQRVIAEAPRLAEESSRRQKEELMVRARGESRLDVSMALHDKRFGDGDSSGGRRVSLRRERREGRIVFLVLVIALTAAVLWLISHLQF